MKWWYFSKPTSLATARNHFQRWNIPRRIRDYSKEKEHYRLTGNHKIYYRRVQLNEKNRGKLYPVCNAGLDLLAHFGVGVGIYFIQLLILATMTFVVGFLMIPSMQSYRQSSYDSNTQDHSGYLALTAVCGNTIFVNVTSGCDTSSSSSSSLSASLETQCEISYRPECQLPSRVIILDMTMSILLVFVILLSQFVEYEVEEALDEAVQSAQDYTIVVKDPDPDAVDPDEWYKFFSRFGKVRYITVSRKNAELGKALLERQNIWERIKDLTEHHEGQGISTKLEGLVSSKNDPLYWKKHLDTIDMKLSKLYLQTYPACKIYVTFETEKEKRLAYSELEVSDFEAWFDIKYNKNYRTLFRGTNVLDIAEPSEPDNILWLNLEGKNWVKQTSRFISRFIALGLLVSSYYIITQAQTYSSTVLSVVVVFADAFLCFIFNRITDLECHPDEAKYQASLQIKLFGVRLLLSTIFPYLSLSWNTFLDKSTISQILSVQISTCFAGALLDFCNIPDYLNKYIYASIFTFTQAEMNKVWSGKPWNLAERYTTVSKILFVSLFYAILTPISLFISSIAFVVVFFVDRFQLLRRWIQPSMINSDVAKRLRQQMLLCVAAHMFITSRLIYSWPMDQGYFNSNTGILSKVNKFPNKMFLYLSPHEEWHSSAQKSLLFPYQVVTGIVCIMVLYFWVLNPFVKWFYSFFFKQINFVGEASHIPFSTVDGITAYVPTISMNSFISQEDYIFADTSQMLSKHLPAIKPQHAHNETTSFSPMYLIDDEESFEIGEPPNLSDHVPPQYRKYILAVVKWYDNDNFLSDDTIHSSYPQKSNPGNSNNDNNSNDSNSNSRLSNMNKLQASTPSIDNMNSEDRDIYTISKLNIPMINDNNLTAKELRVREVIGSEAFDKRMKTKRLKNSISLTSLDSIVSNKSIQSSKSIAIAKRNRLERFKNQSKSKSSQLRNSRSTSSITPSLYSSTSTSYDNSVLYDITNDNNRSRSSSIELSIKKGLDDTDTILRRTRQSKYEKLDSSIKLNSRGSSQPSLGYDIRGDFGSSGNNSNSDVDIDLYSNYRYIRKNRLRDIGSSRMLESVYDNPASDNDQEQESRGIGVGIGKNGMEKPYSSDEKTLLRKIRRELVISPEAQAIILSDKTLTIPDNKSNINQIRINFAEFYSKILILCPKLNTAISVNKDRKARVILRRLFVKAQVQQEDYRNTLTTATAAIAIAMKENDSERKNVILWKDWLQTISNGDFE